MGTHSADADTGDILIIVDQIGKIRGFNAAAETFSGYRTRDVLGREVSLIMPRWNDRNPSRSIRTRLQSGGEDKRVSRLREIVVTKGGTISRVELTISEISMGQEKLHMLLLRDLVRAERFENQLRQAQKMEAIGHLAGGIAHDFNNLLTIIMGNLEMLERQAMGPAQLGLIRDAHETAELGSHLARRLLTLGRHHSVDVRLVDLGDMIDDFLNLLRRALGEQITVRFQAQRQLPPVRVDPALLQMCLFNLALNARDAMPSGGNLHISAESFVWNGGAIGELDLAGGHYVLLSVSDTGGGMPETVRRRALEPFFTTKSYGKGTGLGLPMVQGFVEQADGRMAIESKEGEGTTIRIYLPSHTSRHRASSARSSRAAPVPRGSGELVLLVEDDARVRRWTAERLMELNYRVEEAVSGEEALEKLAHQKDVSLLFTDYVMPGAMNGHQLAAAARSIRSQIKVVITTGYARPEPEEGEALDGLTWLAKPYRTDDLARSVYRALSERVIAKATVDTSSSRILQ